MKKTNLLRKINRLRLSRLPSTTESRMKLQLSYRHRLKLRKIVVAMILSSRMKNFRTLLISFFRRSTVQLTLTKLKIKMKSWLCSFLKNISAKSRINCQEISLPQENMKKFIYALRIKTWRRVEREYRNSTIRRSRKITQNAASRSKSRSWKHIESN